MVASLILALATGAVSAPASPAPSPQASSLPLIVHAITSRSCSALHDTIMPVGFVLKKNDEALGGMADRLQQIFSDFANQGGAPTRAQLSQLGDSNYKDSGKFAMQVDPGLAPTDQLYSPSQIVKASQIDSIANAIKGNLALATQVMGKSLDALPQGTDAKADEMRARAQAVMNLQQSYAENYAHFVDTYVSNSNAAWAINPDQRAFVNAYLNALLAGQQPGANALSAGERTQIASIANVAQNLNEDEKSFGAEVVSTYNQCNGTTTNVNAGSSPKP